MIYLVQAGDHGPIKIGFTEGEGEFRARLRILQTANAEKLYVVAQLPGARARERQLHDLYAAGRMQGEWFRADTPGLQDFIAASIEEEAVRLIEGLRYCSWCKVQLVRPPRTRLCGDECERAKKRDTAARWKQANGVNPGRTFRS